MMSENMAREWAEDLNADELWDALQVAEHDAERGLSALASVSERGSGLAMMYLGDAYLNGKFGIERDAALGENWLSRSLEANSIEGGYRLAYHFMNTNRIDRAVEIYKYLSDKNYAPAQFNLGYIYIDGSSVEKNFEEAVRYFTTAAKNGHLPSERWIRRISSEGGNSGSKFFRHLMNFPLNFTHARAKLRYPNSDRLRT